MTILNKLLLIIFAWFLPSQVFAIEYRLTTPIPGISEAAPDLGSYVATLFQFGLAIVGLIAFGVIVFNGVKYIMGAGNESLVGDARHGITQAIIGILLLIGSITILDTINPCILQTVNFWRNRQEITQKCGAGGLINFNNQDQISIQTTEEYNREQVNNRGTIITVGSNLTITGIENGSNELIRVSIRPDGTYRVFQTIKEGDDKGDWEKNPSASGGSIHDYSFNFIDLESKNEEIQSELKKFLLRQQSLLAVSPAEHHVGVVQITEGNFSSDFTFDIFTGPNSPITSKDNNCKLINPNLDSITPYWRCIMVAGTITGGPADPLIFYIDEFPSQGNLSERTLEGAFKYLYKQLSS